METIIHAMAVVEQGAVLGEGFRSVPFLTLRRAWSWGLAARSGRMSRFMVV
jgi:hypothetical protein